MAYRLVVSSQSPPHRRWSAGGSPAVAEPQSSSYALGMSDLARGIIEHYERHAVAWDIDRSRSAWNDKHWHERFLQALPEQASVLDLGCGSGWPVARHFAAAGLRITGIDASTTMI